ncbi:MAG: hypothetical protein EFKGCFLK_02723 [Rhodocyclaceae bacterium]|nr:hypothetical protein [Rhodocyclaceae bacterium]
MRSIVGLFLSLVCVSSWSGDVLKDVPTTIDPQAKYLIYLPGLAVEMDGPDAMNRYFGKVYQMSAISKAFAEKGFTVIAEARPRGTQVDAYAKKVADQVARLMAGGVAARNMAVVGHSKGGAIVIAAAGEIKAADISYVVLAGCAMPHVGTLGNETPRADYERLMAANKGRFKGRMLSMYDAADDDFRTCKELTAANPELKLDEQVIQSGSPARTAHAIFFAPEAIWFEPLMQWIAR